MIGKKYHVWLLIVLLLSFGACEKATTDASDVKVNLTVAPDPPQVGSATLVVTLEDAEGAPISEADVELEGTMSHAGMTPVFARATEQGAGQYEANLEFTMGGDWIIIVRAKLPDGRSLEHPIDVSGVQVPSRD